MKQRLFISIGIFVAAFLLLAVLEFLMIKYNGTPTTVPNIPRSPETYGSGPTLTYVIVGDSTGVAQGAEYDKGIARGTARFLGKSHRVTMHNLSISGARTADALRDQVPATATLHPDLVLLDVGANDISHFTSTKAILDNLTQSIVALQAGNKDIKIVLTGAPQMGSIPRFPQPVRYAAQLRTNSVNRTLARTDFGRNVILAPLAAETGPVFAKHPELFASDKYHPTAAGYQIWTSVLNESLTEALAQ